MRWEDEALGGASGVRGVRGEIGDGGMERRVGLKGVGLIRRGPLVRDSGIVVELCRMCYCIQWVEGVFEGRLRKVLLCIKGNEV